MELTINRNRVKDAFAAYVRHYDPEDEKIRLKIRHTYRVAEICERIARELRLTPYETDLAWLIGMLHDVGRFEQLRQYGTFVDADSIDHAHFAVELLFDHQLIRDYVDVGQMDSSVWEDQKEGSAELRQMDGSTCEGDLSVVKDAIWNHSAYRIEENIGERALLFSKILRDADKADIFRVAYETPLETLYSFTKQEIQQATVSPEVMQAYREEHAILRSLKKTPVDYLVGHIALAFELEFAASRKVVQEQGYLQKLLSFASDNPKTQAQFAELRERMAAYLA